MSATTATAVAVGGSAFVPANVDSSSFSFSLGFGFSSGGTSLGFGFGWCEPSCFGWNNSCGWTPCWNGWGGCGSWCGWPGWSGFCAFNGWTASNGWGSSWTASNGWGAFGSCTSWGAAGTWCAGGWNNCFSPWWCAPTWCGSWCPTTCWSSWCQPSFGLCFGLPAFSVGAYGYDTFQPPPPVVPVPPSSDQAWSLLATGYDQQAAQDFQALLGSYPDNASYLVGASLAFVLQGNNEAALAQMRAALAQRAEALLAVPADPSLRGRLESVAARLKDRSKILDGTVAGRDALFMLAAVQAILYDNGRAYFAVNTAIDQGDRTPAAQNLKAMLAGRMSV